MLGGLLWAFRHGFDRKVLLPRRKRSWDRLSQPFVHRGARGLQFKLHPPEFVDYYIYTDGLYERRFLEMIELYFQRRGDAGDSLDVGANIGNHAIFLSNTFRKIYCFDPNPAAIERLRGNIALNDIQNIETHQVGLSDKAGELAFLNNPRHNLGASGFVEPGTPGSISLPVVIGDDFLAEIGVGKVSFIKVDVEGHEQHVFDGLERTIAASRPIIAFEFHGGEVGPEAFARIVRSMKGYVFAEAHHAPPDASAGEKLRIHLRQRGRPVISAFTVPEARTYENVLGFPDEQTFRSFRQLVEREGRETGDRPEQK